MPDGVQAARSHLNRAVVFNMRERNGFPRNVNPVHEMAYRCVGVCMQCMYIDVCVCVWAMTSTTQCNLFHTTTQPHTLTHSTHTHTHTHAYKYIYTTMHPVYNTSTSRMYTHRLTVAYQHCERGHAHIQPMGVPLALSHLA